MHASFLIFQLWLAPLKPRQGDAGLKTTLQVGSNLWLKIRVVDAADLRTFTVDDTRLHVRAWLETDF